MDNSAVVGEIDADSALIAGTETAEQSVLVTFQGGGAKGVVHVGALLAVEEQGLTIAGAAGTSAGAMVAALVAGGYSGRELMDPANQSHILETLGPKLGVTKATDLFGPFGWRAIKALRSMAGGNSLIEIGVLVLVVLGLIDVFHPVAALITFLVMVALLGAAKNKLSSGITSVKHVRRFIDHALSEKLADAPNPPIYRKRNVTFRDLHDAGRIPLHIVATNITDEHGEVFSYERTPDVPVADAVAASICLPVIFEPWRFMCARGAGMYRDARERSFQDGGLISNLPVWTLQRHRDELLCPIIAFGIDPDGGSATSGTDQDGGVPKPPERKEKHRLAAIGESVISGTLEIDARGVEDMVHVPIPCSLSLLDFDANITTLFENVEEARRFVFEELRLELTVYPDILRSICGKVRNAVSMVVRGAPWCRPGATRWLLKSLERINHAGAAAISNSLRGSDSRMRTQFP
ncbi:patatin-like phospholipase family protein [Paraburkholderia bannensis]|uniref:patatin-like phospholipase family protein n=1 Tax=Paraburkholderia bannensis TaxID=765414 RepID=UPI0004897D8C|nr:patatin-like phospholipase family protein [Paraburkholderia bannensis]